MTLTADLNWKCKCGANNSAQLYTNDDSQCGEEYINDQVPDGLELNWDEPCEVCGKYHLSEEKLKRNSSLYGWNVIPIPK